VAAACLLGLAVAAPAADDKAGDSKALDRYLYSSLRYVINYGVDLYNAGRIEDCYAHFRQSLQDLEPVLTAHPDLQKTIKEGLDKVEKDPAWRAQMAAKATMPNPQLAPVDRQKAFALRAVFNEVRNSLNPDGLKPEPAKTAGLWNRLGGEKGVSKVIDDFVALAGPDPKVDFTRGGKYKLDDLAVADLKKKLVQFVSQATGGPLKYTGKSMKEVHSGMGITNAQFDAAAADLAKALAKNGVKAEDANALLRIVETTRKDIVEAGKPEATAGGGTIKGRVTANGKPLAKGTITLIDKDGKAISDAIEADGSFTVENAPAGAYKVTITGGKDVPAKYADPNTTPLTFNVVKGMNTHDIELSGEKKQEETKLPRVPPAIAVPAGNAVLGEVHAEGVQIYESKAKDGGSFEWVLKGPEAELSENGKVIGKHYGSKDGPVWEIDGGKITGEFPPKKADAKEGNLPWLLIKVKEAQGKDGKAPPFTVTYVQRVDTEGGVAPAKVPEKAGGETRVKYKATYVVYAADPKKPEKEDAGDVGQISGKATYKGQPLPGGTIGLHTKDGLAVSTPLSEDGTYVAAKVPPGEYVVTLETESVKATAKYVKIPAKYGDPKTSGLKYTVIKGKQQFDIDLTD
jgi:hemoglobin